MFSSLPLIDDLKNIAKSLIFFRSEAPPNLSARAKKNSEGAPGFAERENPRPETRAGENGGQGARTPALQRLHRTVCFARLLRTSRKTGRTYTLRGRNGEGSEGEPRQEKGPRRGPRWFKAKNAIRRQRQPCCPERLWRTDRRSS